ncbi:MAG: hypothetical protein ACM3ZV_02590 [Bacillota bacterium]
MRKAFWVASAAAVALVSTAALASVTYDENGYGFVGKGDVQLAFGWNNKAAQDNAKSVSFSIESDDTYDVTCEWTTTTGGKFPQVIPHAVTNHKSSSVASAISYDARLKNQYTGYTLNGITSTVVTGTAVPAVGDACPPGGGEALPDPSLNDGVITAVDLVSSTGGLYVTYNGTKVLLPLTPVI